MKLSINDSMVSIESDIQAINESITNKLIIEGVNDPGILKCVFIVGGTGSGKSYTAMELFGIDKKLKGSFSSFGLKYVNSDSAFETLLKKNGIDPIELATIKKSNPELWDVLTGKTNSIRNDAKRITKKQREFYEKGRLGLIIDGTGHLYSKIKKEKIRAESLGYDTYMIFVNTTLKVAMERNRNRERVIPDDIVKSNWNTVHSNLGKFKGLFGDNFEIVDNTVYKPIVKLVQQKINKFIKAPIKNKIGAAWVVAAKKLKH